VDHRRRLQAGAGREHACDGGIGAGDRGVERVTTDRPCRSGYGSRVATWYARANGPQGGRFEHAIHDLGADRVHPGGASAVDRDAPLPTTPPAVTLSEAEVDAWIGRYRERSTGHVMTIRREGAGVQIERMRRPLRLVLFVFAAACGSPRRTRAVHIDLPLATPGRCKACVTPRFSPQTRKALADVGSWAPQVDIPAFTCSLVVAGR
jgi:hypothetical protein